MRRVGVLLAGVVVGVAGCGSPSTPAGPDDKHGTVLQRGTLDGRPWTLTAFRDGDGNLCMGTNATNSADGAELANAGCGFGPPDDRLADDVLTSDAGGADQLYYGPAPAGAVTVRLVSEAEPAQVSNGESAGGPGCAAATPARVSLPIPHRLPGWVGPGGWFVATLHVGSACGYTSAVFYDASGKRVVNHHW